MMKTHLLTFALGAVLGAAVVLIVVGPGAGDSGDGPAGKASDRMSQAGSAESGAVRSVAPASSAPGRMGSKSERVDTRGEKKRTVVRTAGNADISKIRRQMLEAERERSAKRVNAKLASLVARLGLDAVQEEQVRALLQRQEETTGRLSHLIKLAVDGLDGENGSSSLALTRPPAEAVDFDGELRALLDQDQLAAYETYRDEKRANEVEIRANQELTRMQRMLDLTAEQKDRAFEALARLAEEDLAGPTTGFDHARHKEQRQKRREAMGAILTPEQLELYDAGGAQMPIMIDSFSNGSASIRVVETAVVTEDPPESGDE